MAHYSLRQKLGLICPSTINRRTKAGKADLQTVAAHPERSAVTAQFEGKKAIALAHAIDTTV
jgi:hypothetical protein